MFHVRGAPGYHVALAEDNEKLIVIYFQLLVVLLAEYVAPFRLNSVFSCMLN
jgi:hypothetical protein